MPDVSIALATHNGEQYLAAQLDSLAQQTSPPAELVIVDDCSGDRTMEIVNAFAARAPFPVRVSRNEPASGFRESFMRAAAALHGGADFVLRSGRHLGGRQARHAWSAVSTIRKSCWPITTQF